MASGAWFNIFNFGLLWPIVNVGISKEYIKIDCGENNANHTLSEIVCDPLIHYPLTRIVPWALRGGVASPAGVAESGGIILPHRVSILPCSRKNSAHSLTVFRFVFVASADAGTMR